MRTSVAARAAAVQNGYEISTESLSRGQRINGVSALDGPLSRSPLHWRTQASDHQGLAQLPPRHGVELQADGIQFTKVVMLLAGSMTENVFALTLIGDSCSKVAVAVVR